MARGYIYEASRGVNDLGQMTEEDFYDACGFIADYFENADRKTGAEELLTFLSHRLVETGYDADDSGQEWPWFRLTEKSKLSYFRPQYEEFRKKASEMTLEKFSQDVYLFLDTIQDRYGPAMKLPDAWYGSIDEAFRNLETGVKYYIGNVVFAH